MSTLNLSLEQIVALLPGHVYWKDKDGICLGCNDKQAHTIGLQRADDCIGKAVFDVAPKKEEAIACRINDLEVMHHRIPRIFEESITLKDGTSLVILSHKTPVFDEKGEAVGLLGVSLDITQHKRQERLLRTKLEQLNLSLEHLITHMPSNIYWKNKEGVCLGSNDRLTQLFGLRFAHEIIGLTAFDLLSKEEALMCLENDRKVMQSGTHALYEEAVCINGQDLVYLSQKAPLRNKQGEIVGTLGISFDITDRKKTAEKEVKQALNAAKKAAKATHKAKIGSLEKKLRNGMSPPLTDIIRVANQLKKTVNTPKFKKDLNQILRASRTLLNVLNDVLSTHLK